MSGNKGGRYKAWAPPATTEPLYFTPPANRSFSTHYHRDDPAPPLPPFLEIVNLETECLGRVGGGGDIYTEGAIRSNTLPSCCRVGRG
jgi:hypothetical protein